MTGPAAGLFAGIVLAVIWVAALNYLYELKTSNVVLLLTTGAMGAVGASMAALVMAAAARREKHRLDEAEHLARHDPLTGLTNRAELFNQLESSLLYAADNDLVLGVLFLDLDRFKTINDSLGHEVGDELLRIVADRLKSTVRNTDVVARLGGDEFVVLCRGLMLSDSVVASAKQILKAFKEPISLNGKSHVVSTSIGVAIAEPGDEREADSLVSDADAAMYRAKRAKSGFAVFDEAHRQMVADRLDIERALIHAIESGQIVVYYQPIVDASSHVLYGFEALVRWHHPEKGMIPPGEFLTIAEEAGMMPQIGTLVLRESCAQIAVWNHAAPGAARIRVGVNLSEQQLTDDSLPDLVAETLAWSGVDPDQLVLEITEDVIVEHLDGLAVLRQLRELGISLSIDDFGTGQSSLSYVKQFDMVSTLKIDQSFVRDMHTANADRAIIEAVVAMATALELKVVAEGVEFPSQLEELRALGVTLIQGYLFGAPMPADQIDPLAMFSADPRPMPFRNGDPDEPGLKLPNVPDQLVSQGPHPSNPTLAGQPTPARQNPIAPTPTPTLTPRQATTTAAASRPATAAVRRPAPTAEPDHTQPFTPAFADQPTSVSRPPSTNPPVSRGPAPSGVPGGVSGVPAAPPTPSPPAPSPQAPPHPAVPTAAAAPSGEQDHQNQQYDASGMSVPSPAPTAPVSNGQRQPAASHLPPVSPNASTASPAVSPHPAAGPPPEDPEARPSGPLEAQLLAVQAQSPNGNESTHQ